MSPRPPEPGSAFSFGFGPSPAPPNAGVCSWCGHKQSPELLVVMSGDGRAGICEHCVEAHSRFFAHQRRRNRRD
jgi:hypothetical protein